MVSLESVTIVNSMQNFYNVEAQSNGDFRFALSLLFKLFLCFRSNPLHFGGALLKTRLFGGQTVAQIYLLLKKLFPHMIISKLDVNFVAPGTGFCCSPT